MIDRNSKEKLILKDCNGYKTIKNVKEIDDMKFHEVDGEKRISRKNIEKFVLSLKDKSKIIRMIFLVVIVFIPTA